MSLENVSAEDLLKIIRLLGNQNNPIIRSRCLIIGEKCDKDNSIDPSDDSY